MYTEAPRLTGKDDPNAINNLIKHLLIALAALYVCLFVLLILSFSPSPLLVHWE